MIANCIAIYDSNLQANFITASFSFKSNDKLDNVIVEMFRK